MVLATHKTQTVYFVDDHEDNKRYMFHNEEAALKWKDELIEEFEMDEENISVIEREYDGFGNWVSQRYI